jgi:hypothetical protein
MSEEPMISHRYSDRAHREEQENANPKSRPGKKRNRQERSEMNKGKPEYGYRIGFSHDAPSLSKTLKSK